MAGISTSIEVPKGKRYKCMAKRLVKPSTAYKCPFVKTFANQFNKMTREQQTLVDYALANDGNKRYIYLFYHYS